jgi:lysophosphatidic acid acyltransferase/lysophosphatidylinositol acyltransferase
MEGGFTFIALPLGLMFFSSGFFINVLQLLATLFVLPVSRRAFRIANMIMMETLWSQLIWLVDWWSGVQVRIYTDAETWQQMGKEHALVISNHHSDIDWLVGWIIAQVSSSLSLLDLFAFSLHN